MPEIDSLSIKISAEASSANKSIEMLSQNLTTLSSKLGQLGGSNLSNFSNAMKTLSEGMKNLNGIKAKDFTPIANGIKKFADIDTGKFSSIGKALKDLASGINAIGGMNFNAESLNGISSALRKLGSEKGTAGSDNLLKIKDSLSQFARGMNEVGSVTFDTVGLSNLITSISKLGNEKSINATKNLTTISAQLQNFVRQLNGIKSVSFDTKSLSDLISSIAKLGGKASAQAASNIPKLAAEIKDLMKALSDAPKVSQNLIDMTNALANLAKTGASSGRAADSISKSFNSISVSTVKTIRPLQSMRSALKDLFRAVAPFIGIYEIFRFGKNAIETASSLKEVQNVVDVTFSDMAYKVEDFAQTSIEQFGMSELTLKQIASRFQAMGTAMNIDTSGIEKANSFLNGQTGGYIGLSDSMADVSLNLTKLTADMASFYNVEQSVVAEDLESVFTGTVKPLRQYGLDLTQATLQEWAMKNGLDANIQSMSQAEKAMLRYQYILSQTSAAQGDFARTSGRLCAA